MITSAYYGAVPAMQPTGGAGPQPNPEITSTESTTRPAGKMPLLSQPGFWVVALVAAAIGLIHVSLRFS